MRFIRSVARWARDRLWNALSNDYDSLIALYAVSFLAVASVTMVLVRWLQILGLWDV